MVLFCTFSSMTPTGCCLCCMKICSVNVCKCRQNLHSSVKYFNEKTQNCRSALFQAPLQRETSCRASDGLVSQHEIMTVWVASAKPQLVTFCLLMMGVHIKRACKQKGVFNSLLLKSWSILICMAVTVLCRKLFTKLSVVCSSTRRSK